MIALPPAQDGPLAELVRRRRTRREFDHHPVDASTVATCLQAAFGITGELPVNEQSLPLTGAPSPGGLNTHDAFLLCRNVAGVEQGTYRYLPREHALAREAGQVVPFDQLFGGQWWCSDAACAIILVADLRRPAYRYRFPTTISATLIEAGARVELLLLGAEATSLSAALVGMTGVGAFDPQLAREAGLPTESSMTFPVCAVLIGRRPNI